MADVKYYGSTNFCTIRPKCFTSYFFYRRARILEQNIWKMVWILVSSLLYFYFHELTIIATFHILHPIHTPTNKQVTARHFFDIFEASTNNRNPATFKMFHWFSQFLSQSRNKELHKLFLFLSPKLFQFVFCTRFLSVDTILHSFLRVSVAKRLIFIFFTLFRFFCSSCLQVPQSCKYL